MKSKSIIKIFTSILMYFALFTPTLLAKTKIFSDSSLSPIEIIDSLSVLAVENIELEQYELTLEYLQRALELSIDTPQKHEYFQILMGLGRTYHLTNNYSLSQQYLFKLLDENDIKPSQALVSDAFNVISANYNNLGDISSAHEYSLKSIEIDEILGDTLSIASSYYNLGSLFFYQDVFEKALDYYKKASELAYQIKNSRLIYNSTAAIGSVYGRLGKTELALELNIKSLHIADSLEYITGQAYSLGNIGSNYLDLGEYTKAQIYIERSLSLKQNLNDRWGQIGGHLTMSTLYSKINNFKLAEENIFTALEIAQSLDAKKRVANIYKDISDHYLSVKNSDLALEYLNLHLSVKDSLMNENVLREMSDRKAEAAIQKEQHTIELLTKDNAILEANRVAQRLKLIAFGLLAVFFLAISIIFKSLLSKQKGLTRLLEIKNNEIEEQKSKIQLQNKALENSNEDLEQFAYVASHDLREPLRMITSYGKILTSRYKDTLDKNGQEFLHFMTDGASRMDVMLLDLLNYARTTSNAQPLENVSTAELMESVKSMTESLFLEKNANLIVNSENFPIIKARRTQLYQLFQNFITNGLKYNLNENPTIKIDCIEHPKEYIFSFTDNGIGIPEKHQVKIFEMFQRLHAKGEFEGTGIGLATCKKIADRHNGRITVQSKEGMGSTFYFHMPKI